MYKTSLASLATLLLWAGVTLGQEHEAPTELPPPRVQEPSAFRHLWDEINTTCFAGSAPTGGYAVTADLDYVLWFLANPRDESRIAATGNLANRNVRLLGALGDAEHAREPGSGGRLALGFWETHANPWFPEGIRDLGAEAVFFFVGQRSARFEDAISRNIVRPFFDVNNRVESGFVVAAPGLATGSVAAHAQADVWGAEANVWKTVYYDEPGTTGTVSVMAGFRYLDLDARIDIGSVSVFERNLAAFPAFLPFAGNTLQVADSFAAHNHFYGAQVGIAGKLLPGECLLIEGGFKIAIGETVEDLTIAGGQLRTLANGRRIASPGGLLALPSNSGHVHKEQFAEVPELDLKLSVPLTSHLTISTGFSALYWSRILRPGQQIERDLDITQIHNFPPAASATPTGLNQPGVPFRQSDLWVLGLHVGLEVTF
jgi:Putative beta barrel porin-7 (BBP7)